jgi:hypothetical protein
MEALFSRRSQSSGGAGGGPGRPMSVPGEADLQRFGRHDWLGWVTLPRDAMPNRARRKTQSPPPAAPCFERIPRQVQLQTRQ